jgi:hypothetical protein
MTAKLIEKIDKKLFDMNNELSALNYELDSGKESALDSIDLLHEKIRNLLMDPKVNDAAARLKRAGQSPLH